MAGRGPEFSDEEFDQHLDDFVTTTVRVVRRRSTFVPTVLLAYDNELRYEVMRGLLEGAVQRDQHWFKPARWWKRWLR
jgi:hypothetical protein